MQRESARPACAVNPGTAHRTIEEIRKQVGLCRRITVGAVVYGIATARVPFSPLCAATQAAVFVKLQL